MKILFLTRYDDAGASSRYRVYEYLPLFASRNVTFFVSPLLDENYILALNKSQKSSVFYLAFRYTKRLLLLFTIYRYDLVYVEKEVFPYLPDPLLLFKVFNKKYIVDFDDAIFHNYDSDVNQRSILNFLLRNKIKKVIKNAGYVVCGSPYLTRYARKYSNNVVEIPTSVDFSHYKARRNTNASNFKIGWIGSKTTSRHLLTIKNAILKFCSNFNCEVGLIGFDESLANDFIDYPCVKVIKWTKNTEIEELSKLSLGIMPLLDEPFERGKCGFKLIQYMACGLPTISTPLEANLKIDRGNGNLFAETENDWYDCFLKVWENQEYYQAIGQKNIETVEAYYSLESNVSSYIALFEQLIK